MYTEACDCGGCEHSDCGGCGCEHSDCGGCSVVIPINGENVTCNIIGSFGVAEMNYIALQPVEDENILLLRYSEKDGGLLLENIESEEEYSGAAEAFKELFIEGDGFEDEDFEDYGEDFDDEDFDDDDLDDDFDDDEYDFEDDFDFDDDQEGNFGYDDDDFDFDDDQDDDFDYEDEEFD